MLCETRLHASDLMYPLFVCAGENKHVEINAMPGNYHWSVDRIIQECEDIYALGIPAILLFGIPEHKDDTGSEALKDSGIVQQAIKQIKRACPDLVVVTDVCLCAYTSHGHCGIVKNETIDNDATLRVLSSVAASHVAAGADIVAPSDMMDGRIKVIRETLDSQGKVNVPIMAYAAKFASAFYGPFREAADSSPQYGDRRSYQMNPANRREALREIELDIEEGSDIVMVKPALAYLDIVREARDCFDVPLAAYNVSGEYAMVKAAAQKGWIDEESVMMEMVTSIKRAGADVIVTYFAKDVARYLRTHM